jgi:hypothetical protein
MLRAKPEYDKTQSGGVVTLKRISEAVAPDPVGVADPVRQYVFHGLGNQF